MKPGTPRKKLTLIFLAVFAILGLCIIYAVILVIKNGDTYEKKALGEATGTETVITAKPGNILDANGTYLTATREVYRLILDPKVLKDTEDDFPGSFDATVALLSKAFGLPESDFA